MKKNLALPIPQATAPHLDDETDPITTKDVMDEPYWIEQPTQKEDITALQEIE